MFIFWQRHRYKLCNYFFITLTVFYWSCAATAPPPELTYKPESPLTAEIAYSVSTPLQVKIPYGWFTAEDKDCKCIDLWLIKDDFSATLNLVALDVSIPDTIENKLAAALEISKNNRGQDFSQTRPDDFYILNERNYAAYEFRGDEGLPIRIVVFKYEDQYFELSAMPASGIGRKSVNTKELFSIQQSVLNSIK